MRAFVYKKSFKMKYFIDVVLVYDVTDRISYEKYIDFIKPFSKVTNVLLIGIKYDNDTKRQLSEDKVN
jgi:hypothetical protein